MEELVVLVDEEDNEIGTMPKSKVHTENTPLHRAFSCFIFNSKGELLLQQRSSKKKTWPLEWSNSVCGHPLPNEKRIDAVHRRLEFELGLKVPNVKEVAPYRYSFTKDGVMENEICPIFVGYTDQEPEINSDEVEDYRWIDWKDFLREIKDEPQKYSPWCVEEALILEEKGF